MSARRLLSLLLLPLLLGAAPAGRFDTDGTTVTDTVTGLVWQREGQAERLRLDAREYCGQLSLGTRPSGWRVPTIKQLQSLVDAAARDPALAPVFSGPRGLYWSSSVDAASPTKLTWVVDFVEGSTRTVDSATGLAAVRCVHVPE